MRLERWPMLNNVVHVVLETHTGVRQTDVGHCYLKSQPETGIVLLCAKGGIPHVIAMISSYNRMQIMRKSTAAEEWSSEVEGNINKGMCGC